MNIDTAADECGALAWIATELFLLEGHWAPEVADDTFAAHLAEASRHHGWHADLWRGCLPDSAALDATARVVPPEGWGGAIAAARAMTSDAARATALARGLLPRLLVRLHRLHQQSAGPGDRTVRRVAGIVMADVQADWIGTQAALERIGLAPISPLDQSFVAATGSSA